MLDCTRRQAHRRSWLAALLPVLVLACDSSEDCRSDADCPSGQICIGGTCYAPNLCSRDSDCPAGQSCIAGTCQVPDPCADSNCPEGTECKGGRCVPVDCPNPGVCVDYETCTTFESCEPCPDKPDEVCNGKDDDCDPATPEEGQPLDCANPGETCRSGVCCADECTSDGLTECQDADHYRRCGQQDVDPCLEWGEPQSCDNGCEAGRCAGCTPDCGTRQCGDDGCGGSCGECDDAPDPVCADADNLREYRTPGWCDSGACEYPFADRRCANGCSAGRCAECQPKTCQMLGYECGPADDGCGQLLDCGICDQIPGAVCADADTLRTYTTGQCVWGACDYLYEDTTCDNGCVANKCRGCTAKTCESLGVTCGLVDDGCGSMLDCGDCGANGTCEGGHCTCAYVDCRGVCCAEDDVCVDDACCTPLTCAGLGWECGSGEDGCGGALDCGSCGDYGDCDAGSCTCTYLQCGTACCAPDELCRAGVCCRPTTCAELGHLCGTPDDGCGGILDCGTCSGCAAQCLAGACQPWSQDHSECYDGDVWWFDSCDSRENKKDDCSGSEICYDGECCLPDCSSKCGGAADGCGGTCTDCGVGSVCQGQTCVACGGTGEPCCAGNTCNSGRICDGGTCVACGGAGQPCCAGDTCNSGKVCVGGTCEICGGNDQPCCAGGGCNNEGWACGASSNTCRKLVMVKLYSFNPGSHNCGDADYAGMGRWATQPYTAGGEEANDGQGNTLDYGWVVLCSVQGLVGAYLTTNDCGSNYSCPAGKRSRGAWHVGAGCTGTAAVDAGGRTVSAGWLHLCVDEDHDEAKVELGSHDCGTNGSGCSGWHGAGAWHVGSECDGASRINGRSGDSGVAGWAQLCRE